MNRRYLTTAVRRLSHDNPLGLPRKGTPPVLTRRVPSPVQLAEGGKTLAVASAKGGVGKSTVAANLALALARRGLRIGILDGDIHGPSIPLLFGLADAGPPRLSSDGNDGDAASPDAPPSPSPSPSRKDEGARLLPLTNYGVRTMSMGYLVPADKPVAWRGLLVQRALQQLLHDVAWGPLDLLVLDLPPGTGDVPLTIAQQLRLDAALLVNTPSVLARADTARGAHLFRTMNIPLLGSVMNMASFVCPCCGEETSVFGKGKGKTGNAEEVPVLANVPLDPNICETGDVGKPIVVAQPESRGALVFHDLAETVAKKLAL